MCTDKQYWWSYSMCLGARMMSHSFLWMIKVSMLSSSVKFRRKNLKTTKENWSWPWAHLQRDIAGFCGNTLHGFVVAAASTAVEHDAGRNVGVFCILRILLEDVQQHLPGLTHTLGDDIWEKNDWRDKKIDYLFIIVITVIIFNWQRISE